MRARLFLARARGGLPPHHVRMAHLLTALSALGAVPLVYGLAVLDPCATVLGVVGVVLPKIWFCDRMVWLHDDIARGDPARVARFGRSAGGAAPAGEEGSR